MKKIGLMGGTFDPIHYGHMMLADQVRTEYNLDEVYFIPAGAPPHKTKKKVSAPEDRLNMTLMATINNDCFNVSSIEINSPELSYTINTIKKLKDHLKEDSQLYFITGADAIYEIETWYNFEELLKITNFIAATRPGIDEDKLKNKISAFTKKYNANISFIEVPSLEISSTDIRERVRNNRSIRYLVPDSVKDYIYKRELYKEG